MTKEERKAYNAAYYQKRKDDGSRTISQEEAYEEATSIMEQTNS